MFIFSIFNQKKQTTATTKNHIYSNRRRPFKKNHRWKKNPYIQFATHSYHFIHSMMMSEYHHHHHQQHESSWNKHWLIKCNFFPFLFFLPFHLSVIVNYYFICQHRCIKYFKSSLSIIDLNWIDLFDEKYKYKYIIIIQILKLDSIHSFDDHFVIVIMT